MKKRWRRMWLLLLIEFFTVYITKTIQIFGTKLSKEMKIFLEWNFGIFILFAIVTLIIMFFMFVYDCNV